MSKPEAYVFVYADDRELDLALLMEERGEMIRRNQLKFLKTGVGKVRAATETTTYLTARLRHREPRPLVISIGTCAALDPSLDLKLDKIVRPRRAVDRDATPELLELCNLKSQPMLQLEDSDELDLTIGTGDGFVADVETGKLLLARGIHLVDMETHAVAWAAMKCYAGQALSVRYVSDVADGEGVRDWVTTLTKARKALTDYVLALTS